MTEDDVLTTFEAARDLKVTERRVLELVRLGWLAKLPRVRPTRIPRWSVERYIREGYDAAHAQPVRQAPAQATAPRRRHRGQAKGPLASEAVGGGHPVSRRVGPKEDDVAVRRVEG